MSMALIKYNVHFQLNIFISIYKKWYCKCGKRNRMVTFKNLQLTHIIPHTGLWGIDPLVVTPWTQNYIKWGDSLKSRMFVYFVFKKVIKPLYPVLIYKGLKRSVRVFWLASSSSCYSMGTFFFGGEGHDFALSYLIVSFVMLNLENLGDLVHHKLTEQSIF